MIRSPQQDDVETTEDYAELTGTKGKQSSPDLPQTTESGSQEFFWKKRKKFLQH